MQNNCNQKSGIQLTQKVDYGIMLLSKLAKNRDKAKSVKIVAEETGISSSFLQKIAQDLQKSNLIMAQRGKYGGYKLAKSPQEIDLKIIIEALEGPIEISPCQKNGKQCKRADTCTLKPAFNQINTELHDLFLSKKLSNFI